MTVSMPKKWGFSDDVFIVPIKVQDAYFTAVMDAPDDWNNALTVSGFKKTNEGWVKRGLANEHELAYLSDTVTISEVDDSFFDSYFNPVDDAPAGVPVPDEVAQAIEWLSLQGRRALAFEFSLIYPELSDVALSGYLDDAAAGIANSDTDIVYELAIERIKLISEVELSASVVEFANEKNISLVVQSDEALAPRGSEILPRGKLVSWVDDDGADRYGRVSRPLRVGDDGCWLHTLPVAWIGGYPSPNEQWVTAKALGLFVEPSAADVVQSGVAYEDAVSFLSALEHEDVKGLANRIFEAMADISVDNYTIHNAWVANGKLWANESLVLDSSYSHSRAGAVELENYICPISDGDRVLIARISDALDTLSKSEYGSESIERTTLCFQGVLGRGSTPSLQYSLSALFAEDKPLVLISNSVYKNFGELTDDSSVYGNFKAYQGWVANNVSVARSYAPLVEGPLGDKSLVVSSDLLHRAINLVVDRHNGVQIFKDRVIELGLDSKLPSDFVHRLVSFEGEKIIGALKAVTPNGLSSILSRPSKLFNEEGKGLEHTQSSYYNDKGVTVWCYPVAKPVLVQDAIKMLVRDEVNSELPTAYYALSGPSYGFGNPELSSIVESAGIGRVYKGNRTSSSVGFVKTDAVFKAGVEHLGEELTKFDGLLKELGCFNRAGGKLIHAHADFDITGDFSQEAFELWKEYSDNFVDAMRIGMVPSKVLAYDKVALANVINGEITRQWGAFFAKSIYSETVANRVREGVLDTVMTAVSKGSVYGVKDFSSSMVDGVMFRISKSSRNISWSSIQVNSLAEGNSLVESKEGANWWKEPRGALLDHAYAESYSRQRGGPKLVIDLLSIVDPELAGRLYNIGHDSSQDLVGQPEKTVEAGHQDTGVVTGYAIKDLRAMSIDSLLVATGNMSSTQREKYIEKKLYFPRPSMVDLQSKGCSPAVAAVLDQAWVLLPSKPYSLISSDIDFYGRLMNAAKEAFDNVLKYEGRLGGDADMHFLEAFDTEMVKSGVVGMLSSQDWERKRFYQKGATLKGVSVFTAFGLHSSYSKGSNNFEYAAQVLDRRFSIRKGGESVKVKDITWDHLLPKKAKPQAASARKVADPDIRTGEDYRKGKTLDSEDFIKTFGFSGVEFGNWTNQSEREAHINLSYDSMLDFSKILECEPMALSLGGRLGLCFGSRGRGGKNPASAHYEPTNMAINLTRRSGAGSLAHEYFHAIAGHYGEVESGIKGSDYSEKLGNMLFSAGATLSPTPLLRQDMQNAFFDLMKAVIYQPPAEEPNSLDLSTYTRRSDMYRSSVDLDNEGGGKEKYWSQPHELFARSMEVWTGMELSKKNARNDYLVSARKLKLESDIYPNAEHIKRISHFADKWVGALRTELKQVQHPFLGEVDMPVFHSKNRVCQPLNRHSLETFALKEMNALFGKLQPKLELSDSAEIDSAGTYDFIKNLMTLNLKHANRDTFYHEAWHACHSTMLGSDEKYFLANTFNQDAVKALVGNAMRDNGYTDDAIQDAGDNPLELQAYAFELWVAGKLKLGEPQSEGIFDDVKSVADSAADISDAFTLEGVESLFERFYGGELAFELNATEELSAGQVDFDACSSMSQSAVIFAPAPKSRGMSM